MYLRNGAFNAAKVEMSSRVIGLVGWLKNYRHLINHDWPLHGDRDGS
jgi:hypothetical protein